MVAISDDGTAALKTVVALVSSTSGVAQAEVLANDLDD